MTKCVFVTGTDTDSGKSVAASLILRTLKMHQCGVTRAFKPVATGSCENADDTRKLMAETTTLQAYNEVTPFSFEPAIAPHIAAQHAGIELSCETLWPHWRQLTRQDSDYIVVEGAGGWMLPLNAHDDMSDFVKKARMTVVVVVGMKLGCINHARLTCRALSEDGIPVAGWIANELSDPPMPHWEQNLATLRTSLAPPYLGTLPYFHDYGTAQLPAPLERRVLKAIESSPDLPPV